MWPVINLTLKQLAEMYALRRGYEPLRADCDISRTDGVDLEQLMEAEAVAWYVGQLTTLPVGQLPVVDVAVQCTLAVNSDGAGSLTLPPGCVAVESVQLRSWAHPVTPLNDGTSYMAEAQANKWARGGQHSPVAVLCGDTLCLYSPSRQGDRVESLRVAKMPAEGEPYPLTPPMLANMSLDIKELRI